VAEADKRMGKHEMVCYKVQRRVRVSVPEPKLRCNIVEGSGTARCPSQGLYGQSRKAHPSGKPGTILISGKYGRDNRHATKARNASRSALCLPGLKAEVSRANLMKNENKMQDTTTFDSSIAPAIIASFSSGMTKYLTPVLQAVKLFSSDAIQKHTAVAVVGAMLAMAGNVAHADGYSGAALGNLINGIRDMATNSAPIPYNVDQMGRDSTSLVTSFVPSKNQSAVSAIGAILSHSAARSLYEGSDQGKKVVSTASANRMSQGNYSQNNVTQDSTYQNQNGSSTTRYNGPSVNGRDYSNVSQPQPSQQGPIFQKMKPLVDREIAEGIDARLAGREAVASAHFQNAVNILFAGKRMSVYYPEAVDQLSQVGADFTENSSKKNSLSLR
jgi:hypothetical protein